MEEIKWWTWMILLGSILALVLLVSSPLSYKYGILPLSQAFTGTMVALVLAVLILLVGVVLVYITAKQGSLANRNYLLLALALSLLPAIVMGLQVQKGLSLPPIHDITTDTERPPVFDKVVALRKNAPNSLSRGDDETSTALLVESQTSSYPHIKSLRSTLSVEKALDRANKLLESQNMVIVNRDNLNGIIEATATTFWFGFKDDVVVRVEPGNTGSVIDVRSVSRVGRSDLGANARRISTFLSAFASD